MNDFNVGRYGAPISYGGYTRTTYNAPSGDVSGGLAALVENYNKAYSEAKTANEQRYQQMLQLSQQGTQQQQAALQNQYAQMLGVVGQTTGQRAADIRSAYGQQQAGMMQQLARRGMSGTTIAPTMQFGVQREQQSALNRLADEMQGTRLGIMGQRVGALGGLAERGQEQRLGIMERRTDAYPSAEALQSIIAGVGSQYGQGQGLSSMLQALAGMRY